MRAEVAIPLSEEGADDVEHGRVQAGRSAEDDVGGVDGGAFVHLIIRVAEESIALVGLSAVHRTVFPSCHDVAVVGGASLVDGVRLPRGDDVGGVLRAALVEVCAVEGGHNVAAVGGASAVDGVVDDGAYDVGAVHGVARIDVCLRCQRQRQT